MAPCPAVKAGEGGEGGVHPHELRCRVGDRGCRPGVWLCKEMGIWTLAAQELLPWARCSVWCGEPQWGDGDRPIFVPFNVCSLAITKYSKFGKLTKSDTAQVYYMCHNCPSKIRIRNPAFKPLLADLRWFARLSLFCLATPLYYANKINTGVPGCLRYTQKDEIWETWHSCEVLQSPRSFHLFYSSFNPDTLDNILSLTTSPSKILRKKYMWSNLNWL